LRGPIRWGWRICSANGFVLCCTSQSDYAGSSNRIRFWIASNSRSRRRSKDHIETIIFLPHVGFGGGFNEQHDNNVIAALFNSHTTKALPG
jgi:hypothetical protein